MAKDPIRVFVYGAVCKPPSLQKAVLAAFSTVKIKNL
jgi:hypothetical protein